MVVALVADGLEGALIQGNTIIRGPIKKDLLVLSIELLEAVEFGLAPAIEIDILRHFERGAADVFIEDHDASAVVNKVQFVHVKRRQ